jgi:hypothetical protein
MAKITVAFSNFANEPKTNILERQHIICSRIADVYTLTETRIEDKTVAKGGKYIGHYVESN